MYSALMIPRITDSIVCITYVKSQPVPDLQVAHNQPPGQQQWYQQQSKAVQTQYADILICIA